MSEKNSVVTIKEFTANPKEIFADRAEKTAEMFKKLVDNDYRLDEKGKRVTKIGKVPSFTQVRKFYSQVLEFKEKIHSSGSRSDDVFREVLPYIYMLKAKAEYSFQRGNINANFKSFINGNIDLIENVEGFDRFCTLFEAVIAYCKGALDKKANEG